MVLAGGWLVGWLICSLWNSGWLSPPIIERTGGQTDATKKPVPFIRQSLIGGHDIQNLCRRRQTSRVSFGDDNEKKFSAASSAKKLGRICEAPASINLNLLHQHVSGEFERLAIQYCTVARNRETNLLRSAYVRTPKETS